MKESPAKPREYKSAALSKLPTLGEKKKITLAMHEPAMAGI